MTLSSTFLEPFHIFVGISSHIEVVYCVRWLGIISTQEIFIKVDWPCLYHFTHSRWTIINQLSWELYSDTVKLNNNNKLITEWLSLFPQYLIELLLMMSDSRSELDSISEVWEISPLISDSWSEQLSFWNTWLKWIPVWCVTWINNRECGKILSTLYNVSLQAI